MRSLKALLASAFLFSAPLVSAAPVAAPLAAANCQPPAAALSATLDRVIDGDTLQLNDGRRVRLIGVDTPELARAERPAQPLAEAAREASRRFLAGGRLRLLLGQQPQDRHGRSLAHVFDAAGNSLEAALLRQGLGFGLSMPPNLALRDCLRQAEADARAARRGVWSEPYFAPREARRLQPGEGGFGRYRGTVTQVGRNRGGPFLELDQTLYLPVSSDGLPYFGEADFDALAGQRVEVRGWLSYRALSASQRGRGFRPFRLYLSHPDHLTVLGTK